MERKHNNVEERERQDNNNNRKEKKNCDPLTLWLHISNYSSFWKGRKSES